MTTFKNRTIFSKIRQYLTIPEIIVIHGSRQVGKTTLMKMAMEYLREKKAQFFYFDLEEEVYFNLCNSGYVEVVKYINLRKLRNTDKQEKIYVFIDEIQYLDNPSSFLKLLYDHHKEKLKIIVSGSSSFEIKSKFKNSLVGRIIDIELFGLSFEEFLDFKDYSFDFNLKQKSAIYDQELKNYYQEYISYGFYPQVVLAENLELKNLYIRNIIEKYIYKDIRDIAKIKDIKKFNNLLKCLAAQTGQLVNVNELSNTLNIARQTIEEYLFILENTYIIKLVSPYHNNLRSELTKMSKVYFEDLGILNYLNYGEINSLISGNLFENSIYCYLRRLIDKNSLYFWRTMLKQDIDFIIAEKKIIPIEVKLSYRDKNMKNLLYFMEKYHLESSYCATLNKKEQVKYKNIQQLYPWEILSKIKI